MVCFLNARMEQVVASRILLPPLARDFLPAVLVPPPPVFMSFSRNVVAIDSRILLPPGLCVSLRAPVCLPLPSIVSASTNVFLLLSVRPPQQVLLSVMVRASVASKIPSLWCFFFLALQILSTTLSCLSQTGESYFLRLSCARF